MAKVKELRTACAYIRVSTDKQEELSPDAQKRLILDYAKKNGMILNHDSIFIENGISGKKAEKRPEFMKMIGMAKSKNHPYDVILVWKYSRFARNQEESIVYKNLLKKNNIDVISISEPIIDGPFGALIERIIEWMDEYYSIRLSGEVMRGMTENALRGGYQSNPPLGYCANKLTGIPDIVPEDAALVQKIFNIYAYEDPSFISIARQLNEMNYRTRSGNTYEARTVRYILENPFYIGKVRWNRQHHESHTIKDSSEWIIADGKHEPIISTELFDLVQERIKIYTLPYKSRGKTADKHWLSGFVKCGACGSTLGVSSLNVPCPYLQCIKYGKGQCQTSHSISLAKITAALIEALHLLCDSPEPIEFEEVCLDTSAGEIESLKKQLEALTRKEQRAKQAYINEIDTLEEYKATKTAIAKERKDITNRLKEICEPASTPDAEYRKKIYSVADVLASDEYSNAQKRAALGSIVKCITFHKRENHLEIELVNYV